MYGDSNKSEIFNTRQRRHIQLVTHDESNNQLNNFF